MRSLGFGLERLGLIPLRYPWQTLLIILAFTTYAASGLFHLQPEGKISEVYRGQSVAYAEYEKISKLFPVSELDILLLITGKDLLNRQTLDEVRAIQEEVEFMDGVESTLSMFSLRGDPEPDGSTPPLFPAELGEYDDNAYQNVLTTVRKHPDVLGKMLSKPDRDGSQTSLVILNLNEEAVKEGTLKKVLANIKTAARELADPAGLEIHMAGIPVIQQEIRNSIKRDMLIFNLAGFVIGTLINFFFIRRLVFVFVVGVASVLANIWVLGILGHFGQTLNAFMTIVPPLIMVIAVSDGMHLVLDIYKKLREGASKTQAIKKGVLSIGPACALTSLTTTIALLSMTITDSAVIKTFGLTAALGTVAAFLSVILVIPTLTMLMLRNEAKYQQAKRKSVRALQWLESFSARSAGWTTPKWRFFSFAAVIIIGLFSWLHYQLEPVYRLTDEIPDNPSLTRALDLVDEKLGGGVYLHVLVTYGKDKTVTSSSVLAAIGEVHRLLASLKPVNDVVSVEKTRLWFKEHGIEKVESLKKYLDELPDFHKKRLLNEAEHAAIVSGKTVEMDAGELSGIVKNLRHKLKNIEAKYQNIQFTISGLSAVSAQQSTNIIVQLSNGLLLAIFFVVVLIGIAFRSLQTAAISIIPNILPIVTAGTLLYVTDSGLQYASILGLTVAFGLAVDDTIHFLNRYRLEGLSSARPLQPEPVPTQMLAEAQPQNTAHPKKPVHRRASRNTKRSRRQRKRKQQPVQQTLAAHSTAVTKKETPKIPAPINELLRVKNTITHIGPALILTTLILICGLAVTVFSNLHVTRLFGELSIATLSAALLADMIFLPAILLFIHYMKKGKKSGATP